MKRILFLLLAAALLFGCTELGGSGTNDFYVINNNDVIFDVNANGDPTLVPFFNDDGNLLESETDFNYDKNTNTLFVENFVGDGNIFLTSPNGTSYSCDVTDAGNFECS